jgi:hypothetical protein
MANRGRRRGPRNGGDRDREHEYDRREPEPDPRGRDFPVISKIRGDRWLGSTPPTAEAYARALGQWRQLPGAIGTTATDLGNAADTAKPVVDGAPGEDTQ